MRVPHWIRGTVFAMVVALAAGYYIYGMAPETLWFWSVPVLIPTAVANYLIWERPSWVPLLPSKKEGT